MRTDWRGVRAKQGNELRAAALLARSPSTQQPSPPKARPLENMSSLLVQCRLAVIRFNPCSVRKSKRKGKIELDMRVIVSQEIKKKIKLQSAFLTVREIEWTQVSLGRQKLMLVS